MDNTEFTAEQIGNQAQLNAVSWILATIAYLKERSHSIEDWATFHGERAAPGWKGIKERGSPCDRVAWWVALNFVACKGTLVSLSGDETHAEMVIAWPPKDLADDFGLPMADAQRVFHALGPIAETLGLRFEWQSDGEQVKLAFSR